MNAGNRLRALADVVTLDPIQELVPERAGRYNIYADVFFQTVRIGAEDETPIRFRLSLKRAEVLLRLPETDPLLHIDFGSVQRKPEQERSKSRRLKVEQGEKFQKAQKIASSSLFSSLALKLGFSTEGQKAQDKDIRRTIEEEEEIFSMRVVGRRLNAKEARWSVEAGDAAVLRNAPWDQNTPLAVVVDQGFEDRRPGMEAGGITFEIRCTREDLSIDEVELKSPSLLQKHSQSSNRRAQTMAINQYIKSQLSERHLDASNIEDPFGSITLLNALIENDV